VHQLACSLGFGVNAVNPWLALELVAALATSGKTSKPVTAEQARKHYTETIGAGLLKIMAKMGISTLFSYRGAQMFEALGLSAKVMGECFTGTPSPIGGIDYRQIAEEAFLRHARAFPALDSADPDQIGRGRRRARPAQRGLLPREQEGRGRVSRVES